MITGASAGIGAEIVRTFSAAGHPLLLLARRRDRLLELGLPDAVCCEADMRDRAGIAAAIVEGEAMPASRVWRVWTIRTPSNGAT